MTSAEYKKSFANNHTEHHSSKNKKNKFKNFTEREYDFDELERQAEINKN